MRKRALLPLSVGALVVSAVLGTLAAPAAVEARPQYRSVYIKLYPDDPWLDRFGLACFLCHQPKDDNPPIYETRSLNPYGRKVAAALGEKNVRDPERIREALLKVGPFPGKDE